VLHLAEMLKDEMRHSWTSKGRRESVAEHTWRTSLMAILFFPYLSLQVDLLKALKMIIVHDIVEARAGDVPVFEVNAEIKKKEALAICEIRQMLNNSTGDEIYELWQEFEMGCTNEAKFAKALDKIEANLQHNEANLSSWTIADKEQVFKIDAFCQVDPYLQEVNEKIKQDALLKMSKDVQKKSESL
jgi:putative hydrolases of HD superfamily